MSPALKAIITLFIGAVAPLIFKLLHVTMPVTVLLAWVLLVFNVAFAILNEAKTHRTWWLSKHVITTLILYAFEQLKSSLGIVLPAGLDSIILLAYGFVLTLFHRGWEPEKIIPASVTHDSTGEIVVKMSPEYADGKYTVDIPAVTPGSMPPSDSTTMPS